MLLFTLVTKPTYADSCQKLAVISIDGYSNVRSEPNINKDNIVGTLATGTGVQQLRQNQQWVEINVPINGWIANNQIAEISCDAATKTLIDLGLPTISTLSNRAIQGDSKAAKTIIKMALGVDGITAEAYAIEISNWAIQNPNSMISNLEQQPWEIRRSFLDSLNFGLGNEQSSERSIFEDFLNKLSQDHPIVQDWQCLTKVFHKSKN